MLVVELPLATLEEVVVVVVFWRGGERGSVKGELLVSGLLLTFEGLKVDVSL